MDALLSTQRRMVEDPAWFEARALQWIFIGPKDGVLLVGVRAFTPEQDVMVKQRWGSYVELTVTNAEPVLLPGGAPVN